MIVPSAWRAEARRGARGADIVEPNVVRLQRKRAFRVVLAVVDVVAFRFVIEYVIRAFLI